MATPSTGPISMSQVNSEINWHSNRTISFGDAQTQALAERAPGQSISMGQMRGKTFWALNIDDYTQVAMSQPDQYSMTETLANVHEITMGPMSGAWATVLEITYLVPATVPRRALFALDTIPSGWNNNLLRNVRVTELAFSPFVDPEVDSNALIYRLTRGDVETVFRGSAPYNVRAR